jgi:hypothetical protein
MDSSVSFGGVSKPKVEWVKDAVINFVNYLLGSVTSSDYNIGIVQYSTGAQVALELTAKSAITVDLISASLALVPPRERTAMGKGLAWALNRLCYQTPPAGYNGLRSIVHLADGQQNEEPYVVSHIPDPDHPEQGNFTIDCTPSYPNCPTNMGLITVQGNAIPVHTLGIGGNWQWFQIMTQVSGITGGTHLEDGQIWPLVDRFFINSIPDLFPYASPQIVRNAQEVMRPGAENRFSFQLNSSVHKLVVCSLWAGATGLMCTLRKGNRTVVFDTIVEKQGLFIGTVSFPHYEMRSSAGHVAYLEEQRIESRDSRHVGVVRSQPLFEVGEAKLHGRDLPVRIRATVDPSGDWAVLVSKRKEDPDPTSDYPFLLAVIVDEKEVKYRIDPFLKTLWAGAPMPFGVALAQGPSPYPGVVAPLLSVSMPTTSLSNILAARPDLISTVPPGEFPPHGEIQDVRRRQELLLQNKEIAALLGKRQTKQVSLKALPVPRRKVPVSEGNKLAGSLVDTTVPGTYLVEIIVRATDKKTGVYQRVKYGNVLVRVKPDFSSSTLEGKVDAKTVLIVFTPRDRFKNCLGAGYGEQFFIDFPGIKVTRVDDDLSGTYHLEATLRAPPISQGDFNAMREKFFYALLDEYMRH